MTPKSSLQLLDKLSQGLNVNLNSHSQNPENGPAGSCPVLWAWARFLKSYPLPHARNVCLAEQEQGWSFGMWGTGTGTLMCRVFGREYSALVKDFCLKVILWKLALLITEPQHNSQRMAWGSREKRLETIIFGAWGSLTRPHLSGNFVGEQRKSWLSEVSSLCGSIWHEPSLRLMRQRQSLPRPSIHPLLVGRGLEGWQCLPWEFECKWG